MMSTMDLASAVLTYYFTHIDDLPRQKQFHLGSRMAAWNGDERAKQLVEACGDWFLPSPLTPQTLAASLEEANQQALRQRRYIVAYGLRKPFFDQYPTLIGLEAELFRLRHLGTIYGIDARAAFLSRHSLRDLKHLEEKLLADPTALRMLSTWATNYLYLVHRIVLQEETGIDVQLLYDLGKGYDLADNEQLRLYIYLYTHCIIAESNFYVRRLPQTSPTLYQQMLRDIEAVLSERLAEASLDTKLEFLVCCRLGGYETTLTDKIRGECANSLSAEGTFIVDTHNVFANQPHKKSFGASEHRNVLFAMSSLPRLDR